MLLDRLQHAGEVLGEHRRREPELAVVGQREGLVGIGGASHRQHGAEQFVGPDVGALIESSSTMVGAMK